MKATLADMRAPAARRSRPGIKTFGSTFKNPDDPRAEGRSAGVLLDEAGCRGLTVGGARFSEKHANFVENMGDATTADVIALMAEGRRQVRERFGVELEPEVQILGDVDAVAALEGRPREGADRAAARRPGCAAPRPRLGSARVPRARRRAAPAARRPRCPAAAAHAPASWSRCWSLLAGRSAGLQVLAARLLVRERRAA